VLAKGNRSIPLDAAAIAEGAYMLMLDIDGVTTESRMVVVMK
jgi:hypothetical protein